MKRGSAFGSAFGAQQISLQLRRPAALHSELTICGEIFSRRAAPSREVSKPCGVECSASLDGTHLHAKIGVGEGARRLILDKSPGASRGLPLGGTHCLGRLGGGSRVDQEHDYTTYAPALELRIWQVRAAATQPPCRKNLQTL